MFRKHETLNTDSYILKLITLQSIALTQNRAVEGCKGAFIPDANFKGAPNSTSE